MDIENRLNEVNYGMVALTFELTRRCNMNCDFCAKGEAQEVDITKEIVDKMLDEVQNFYIHILRLGGGEPFLNPEMAVYIIDQVIKRHIYVKYLAIFTNGLIRDKRIKAAFKRFIQYLRSIENEVEILEKNFNVDFRHNYTFNDEKVIVIISSYNHPVTKTYLDNTAEFYNSGMNQYDFLCVTQDCMNNPEDIVYIVSGKFKKNYKSIMQDKKAILMRIPKNKYHFVFSNPQNEIAFICKNLSISTNGNVFPGASLSYKDIDEQSMFNISSCKNDFMERVVDWCWLYPTIEKVNYLRELYEGTMWGDKHNISCLITREHLQHLKKYYDLSYECQKLAQRLHEEYPEGNFSTIYNLSVAVICYANTLKCGLANIGDIFLLGRYLEEYTTQNMVSQPIDQTIKILINKLKQKHKNDI